MKIISLVLFVIALCLTSCGDATKGVFTNYEEKKSEIDSLASYFNKIKPKELVLFIRFNSDDNIDFKLDQKNYHDKTTWYTEAIFDDYGQFHRFDIDLDNKELEDAFKIVNLDKEKIEKLRTYLDKANCNSISNSFSIPDKLKIDYSSIGYPTNDLYGLEYLIFDTIPEQAIIDEIVKGCNFKKINKRILVQYGGPAFGSDCFPDKK
ncbi:hypothetical protein GU926_05285 [Nibribacter ruber]|uniref:Lipoprotein n=1 Tax=Nibribacter ruber TaxID=2698458 RepID=A0A6P1NYL9_9BACT|nr:hypothetical protein [Nibribacter ruber]QHL86881.1 hypothetical protein GU926_05285 [Nibribacter ruber]